MLSTIHSWLIRSKHFSMSTSRTQEGSARPRSKILGPLSPRRGVPVRGSLTPPSGRDAPPQRPSRVSARIFVGPLAERTYKNPTEDASPAPGGTGLRPSRGKLRARNWVGPNSERINCPPPQGGGTQFMRPSLPYIWERTYKNPT